MADAVLDASAILAIYLLEPGAEKVAPLLQKSSVAAVNIAEVMSTLMDRNATPHVLSMVEATLKDLAVPVDYDLARRAARLRTATRKAGLSLADRICLSLGARTGLPVITADRVWAKLDIGVEIRVIR